MLPRSKRLTTTEFSEVFMKGKVFHSPFFTVRALSHSGRARIAVVVSKKVAKTAVARNRIRRRVYSAVRDILPTQGFEFSLSVKIPLAEIAFSEIVKELKLIFAPFSKE